jgi:hypothetical protein
MQHVLRDGQMYLRLALNTNETVVSGEADYDFYRGVKPGMSWSSPVRKGGTSLRQHWQRRRGRR